MKITAVTSQIKNPDRVNISVDGTYRFSLDVFQVVELGIRPGKDYTEAELQAFEDESVFGKLYTKAVEYTMLRPHSAQEIKDYLRRKTLPSRYRSRRTGEIKETSGVSKTIADRVYERLVEKGYIDDVAFATWWVENRDVRKGTSARRLHGELRAKGVDGTIIDDAMQKSPRDEKSELRTMIQKKRSRYEDETKLIAYLLRQGFSYSDIRAALSEDNPKDD